MAAAAGGDAHPSGCESMPVTTAAAAGGYANPSGCERMPGTDRTGSGGRRRSMSLYPPPESMLYSCNDEPAQTEENDSDSGTDVGKESPVRSQTEPVVDATRATDHGRGPEWHAKIMTDDYGNLKPRRPLPEIKISEFLTGLKEINGRWILEQPLNDWPGLVNLELVSLTCRRQSKMMVQYIDRFWTAGRGDKAAELPAKSDIPKRTRATFAAPAWTARGWAPESPGFVWWYERHSNAEKPTIIFGEQMVNFLQQGEHASAVATTAHTFAHRYPVAEGHETLKDKQIWHAGVLVEWSHGKFTTLIELAFLNGCGGYQGRSNWCEDKRAETTQLDFAMPASMKCPWDCGKSEIRVYDMPFRSKEEFETYLGKYCETGGLPMAEMRFVQPDVYASAAVRIRGCTPAQLAGYLLNYISRAADYIEWEPSAAANCQTFAADLFSFLTGNENVEPYGAVVRAVYRQRNFSFMYMPRDR